MIVLFCASEFVFNLIAFTYLISDIIQKDVINPCVHVFIVRYV